MPEPFGSDASGPSPPVSPTAESPPEASAVPDSSAATGSSEVPDSSAATGSSEAIWGSASYLCPPVILARLPGTPSGGLGCNVVPDTSSAPSRTEDFTPSANSFMSRPTDPAMEASLDISASIYSWARPLISRTLELISELISLRSLSSWWVLISSLTALRKSLVARLNWAMSLPIVRATSGRRLGPMMTTPKITSSIISFMPMPNMA